MFPSPGAGRAEPLQRVGLFVDFDCLEEAIAELPELTPAALALILRGLGEEHGRVAVAVAYGDWTRHADAAHELSRQHIEPHLAIGESSEVMLCLDATETLYVGPHLDIYVLVTDDRSMSELRSRLRRADRAVTLVAAAAAVAPDAFADPDRFVSIDEFLRGEPRARPATAPPAPSRIDFMSFDWAPFVHLVDELEQTMPFVGFGWLLKKKLCAENCGCASLQDKQDLMDRAVEDRLLTLYKVDNIDEGADPVTACKLNRDHVLVTALVTGE